MAFLVEPLYLIVSILILTTECYEKKTKRRLDQLVSKVSYAKEDPPLRDGVTEVGIGIYINNFYSISEQTMDYSLSIYFRQNWTDPRLIHKPKDLKLNKTKLDKAWMTIWVPDTFFLNEKKSGFHKVTVDNRMADVSPTGNVWYVMKLTATLSCPMLLHKYPMDTQSCPMIFESFGYTTEQMRLYWIKDPVQPEQLADLSLPQFLFDRHELHNCTQNYTTSSTGIVSCLEIAFVIRRTLGFYFIQLFVPSMLIVILSWVSFWINVDAAPARVSLGLLTVLTMTNHSISINANLPRVSYVKAVDVWMSSCLLFVFAALCEYAFVNVASRKRVLVKVPQPVDKKRGKGCVTCLQIIPRGAIDHEAPPAGILAPIPSPKSAKATDLDGKGRAKGIDKIARKSFPLAFIIFNIVYWVGYTYQIE